jgi:hypothetical protein
MKLSKCEIGKVVVTEDLEVGHIVGFEYNVALENTHGMSKEDLYNRTIPTVKFPRGKRGIHPSNISILK